MYMKYDDSFGDKKRRVMQLKGIQIMENRWFCMTLKNIFKSLRRRYNN
jgi:hypothetical protein